MSDTVRTIAFYLPQFYHLPENDEWWGKGFTEWRSSSTAVPLFKGHHQPHLPSDLGFYTQTHLDSLRAQIELAQNGGVNGFCHYYYWFNGRRILNKPTELWLNNSDLDMPICLCWANEHWSRRWDGDEADILMPQSYNVEEYPSFAKDLIPYFSDPRYICDDNKAVFLIYRPQEVPQLNVLCDAIRNAAKLAGRDGAYILGAETFVEYGSWSDPTKQGLDGAVEFPPHAVMHQQYILTEKERNTEKFEGNVFSANSVLKGALLRDNPRYPLHRTVFPSWDNTARLNNRANFFVGTSPDWFAEWFSAMFDWTKLAHQDSRQFLFVNAWNEWAEGAHLEPDLVYGSSYLDRIKAILTDKFKSKVGIEMFDLFYLSNKARVDALEIISGNLEKKFEPQELMDEKSNRLAQAGRTYDVNYRKFPYELQVDPKRQFVKGMANVRSWGETRRIVGNALKVDTPTKKSHHVRNKIFGLIHKGRRWQIK